MRTPAALVSLLLAVVSHTAAPHARAAGGAPARAVLSRVPADLPWGSTDGRGGAVEVRVWIAPSGVVDSARAIGGEARLRGSAEAAARWWIFAPAASRDVATVPVTIETDPDFEAPRPDVVAMARDAERRHDVPAALVAWTGALARAGRNGLFRNEWAVREHVLALGRAEHELPAPPPYVASQAHGLHAQQERTVTTRDHADLADSFGEVTRGAPWVPQYYLWRAASELACGRRAEALRSLRAYSLGVRDSAGIATARRTWAALAAGDTLGTIERIKNMDQVHRPENAID